VSGLFGVSISKARPTISPLVIASGLAQFRWARAGMVENLK